MGRADGYWGNFLGSYNVELAEAVDPVYPLPVDAEHLKIMQQNYPVIAAGVAIQVIQPGFREHLYIKPGGQGALANIMSAFTRDDVSADVVYTYTKAWLDNIADMQAISKTMAPFGPDMIKNPSSIPYHDGAIKALKEAGMWTMEMEETHQALLKK